MKITTEFLKKLSVALLLALITLAAGRGLFSLAPLAGHDAPAYPVNQAQFMDNLRDGVLFPRWSSDTRYGYGQPQLQFRPPLLHYLASPIHAATGNPFLALHLALLGGLFMAAWGAYALARLRVGEWVALVAAAGFVCANYMLANLYLRGAYYEVMASAAMPWILWAQSRENIARRRALLIGPLAWAALLTAHPAVAFFFFPLAAAHAVSEFLLLASAAPWAKPGSARSGLAHRWNIFTFSLFFLVLGILLSAPYTWVMLAERHWVRMEIFLTNLDSWRRHFFSLREWFTERWPETYVEYRGVDYLRRALHAEMRGLNIWAVVVLIFSPLVWWLMLWRWRHEKLGLRKITTDTDNTDVDSRLSTVDRQQSEHIRAIATLRSKPSLRSTSREIRGMALKFRDIELPDNRRASAEKLFFAIFFYAAAWITVALSLRLSLPVWDHIPLMDTFNYPWRVLGVTSLCLALAAAYGVTLVSEIMKQRGHRLACIIPIALLVLAPLAEAIPHTGGRPGLAWLTRAELTSSAIRRHAGIPQQFYTPTWVQRYATEPAPSDAQVVAGLASITVTERHPTQWQLRVDASTTARIALSHYYYPGWRIHRQDGVIMKTEPWGERALISFIVPPGTHTLSMRFGATPARRAVNFASIAGLAFMLFGVLWPRRTHPPLSPGRSALASAKPGHKPLSLNCLGSPSSDSFRSVRARRSFRVKGWLKAGVGATILLVGAILLAEYLASVRDDESLALQAGKQLAEGKTQAAIHSFARLLRERETDIAARYSLGAAYHNYGWHDEALASYDNILNLADEYAARAAHSAARINLMRKDFERARLYYEAALRHRPDAKDIRAEYEQLMLLRRQADVGREVSFP